MNNYNFKVLLDNKLEIKGKLEAESLEKAIVLVLERVKPFTGRMNVTNLNCKQVK